MNPQHTFEDHPRTHPRYRLDKPTVGLQLVDGKRCCMIVPAGAVINIPLEGLLNGEATVDVQWKEYVLTMFSEDVRERTVALDNTESDRVESRSLNTRDMERGC